MFRTAIPIAIAACLLAPDAHADKVSDYLRTLEDNPKMLSAVGPALRELADAGLPTAYAVAKAKEGVAKRVPPMLLKRVMGQLAANVKAAPSVLPKGIPHKAALVEIIGQALQSGIARRELSGLLGALNGEHKMRSAEQLRRSVSLLIDVHELGVGSKEAGRLLIAIVQHDKAALIGDGRVLWTLRRLRQGSQSFSAPIASMIGALAEGGTVDTVGADVPGNPQKAHPLPPSHSSSPHKGSWVPKGLQGKNKEPKGQGAGSNGDAGANGNNGNAGANGNNGNDKTPPGQSKDKSNNGQGNSK